jgi:DNA helicase TIP49 (TBP-interacting protein)
MLDIECFTYLNRALESPIAPIVVLASNRGMAAIRGADDLVAAHGVPPDFLSRLLIIPTHPYDGEEIKRIVRIRSSIEGVQITDAAIDKIAEHGVRISLRYCLQLLTPARYVVSGARCRGRECVWRKRKHTDRSAAFSRGSMVAARSTSRMSQNARTSSWTPGGAPASWPANPARALFHNRICAAVASSGRFWGAGVRGANLSLF